VIFDFFEAYAINQLKHLEVQKAFVHIFSAPSKSTWLSSFFIQASCIGSVFQPLHLTIDQSFFCSDFLADVFKHLRNFL
jgi:hypothetical protein